MGLRFNLVCHTLILSQIWWTVDQEVFFQAEGFLLFFYDKQLLPSISKGGLVHLFPLKISEVTLQSVSLTFFTILALKTWCCVKHFLLVGIFLYSHHLSVKWCTVIK